MKNLKTTFIILTTIAIMGCNSENDRVTLENKMKVNIENYIKLNFFSDDENLKFEKITIIDIDTLTEFSSLNYKYLGLEKEKTRLVEIYELEQSLIEDYISIGIDENTLSFKRSKIEEYLSEITQINNQQKNIAEQVKTANNNDYKYYFVSIKIFYEEKLAVKNIEIQLALNENYRVVESKDM